MNIVPSEEQLQSLSSVEQSVTPPAQHGQQIPGAQPHLNPNAMSFQPGEPKDQPWVSRCVHRPLSSEPSPDSSLAISDVSMHLA